MVASRRQWTMGGDTAYPLRCVDQKSRSRHRRAETAVVTIIAVAQTEGAFVAEGIVAGDATVDVPLGHGLTPAAAPGRRVEEATVESAAVVADDPDPMGGGSLMRRPGFRVLERHLCIVAQPAGVEMPIEEKWHEVDVTAIEETAVKAAGVQAIGNAGIEHGPGLEGLKIPFGIEAHHPPLAVAVGYVIEISAIEHGADAHAEADGAPVPGLPGRCLRKRPMGVISQGDASTQGYEVDVPTVKSATVVGSRRRDRPTPRR